MEFICRAGLRPDFAAPMGLFPLKIMGSTNMPSLTGLGSGFIQAPSVGTRGLFLLSSRTDGWGVAGRFWRAGANGGRPCFGFQRSGGGARGGRLRRRLKRRRRCDRPAHSKSLPSERRTPVRRVSCHGRRGALHRGAMD